MQKIAKSMLDRLASDCWRGRATYRSSLVFPTNDSQRTGHWEGRWEDLLGVLQSLINLETHSPSHPIDLAGCPTTYSYRVGVLCELLYNHMTHLEYLESVLPSTVFTEILKRPRYSVLRSRGINRLVVQIQELRVDESFEETRLHLTAYLHDVYRIRKVSLRHNWAVRDLARSSHNHKQGVRTV